MDSAGVGRAGSVADRGHPPQPRDPRHGPRPTRRPGQGHPRHGPRGPGPGGHGRAGHNPERAGHQAEGGPEQRRRAGPPDGSRDGRAAGRGRGPEPRPAPPWAATPRGQRPGPYRPGPARPGPIGRGSGRGPGTTQWVAPLAPDEEIVAGVRPVEEAFAARRDALRLLVSPHRRSALDRLVLHATTLRIPVVELEGGTLTAITGFDGHQGVALVARRRPRASLTDVIAAALTGPDPALILVLDSLEDPQNLGSLLRTGEAAGVHGVLVPARRSAPLSPAAVKASAGAVEHLRIAVLDDLPGALAELRSRGILVVGSDAEAPLTVREADLRGPVAIIVGSEGKGLAPAIRRRCDLLVRIPMRGHVGSLNAAVAGSVLLYEAIAQRTTPAADQLAVDEPPVDDPHA